VNEKGGRRYAPLFGYRRCVFFARPIVLPAFAAERELDHAVLHFETGSKSGKNSGELFALGAKSGFLGSDVRTT
jgi:hypothetical protein